LINYKVTVILTYGALKILPLVAARRITYPAFFPYPQRKKKNQKERKDYYYSFNSFLTQLLH